LRGQGQGEATAPGWKPPA